ncbi:MAG: alpha/beta fold hydrolase [Rhodospirillaceae bacterium]|nr:alpha/beta fold hydrolase [Rhodospirillaceae bacterium]
MADSGLNPLATFDLPPFRPLPLWRGGDLQTLRNWLKPPRDTVDEWPSEICLFDCNDGSGDRLVARLHQPEGSDGKPLLLLIHGLSGCEDSFYVRVSAGHLLAAGYPVLRLNLRGAGPGRSHARWTYHAGRSADLAACLAGLDPALKRNGIVAVGYSLGGNLLLKYLGEAGANADLLAAVSISAPIDLKAAQQRLGSHRNRLYHAHLLANMRVERGPSARNIRSIREFDSRIVAPENGFRSADEYYAECSATRYLAAIRRPTLVIHAGDDPWIPAMSYATVEWDANPNLHLKLPVSGGHVGFHGQGLDRPWYDMAIQRFLALFA